MIKTFILLVLLIFIITSCTNTAEVMPASAKVSQTQTAVQTQQLEASNSQALVQTQQPSESNNNHVYLTQDEFIRLSAPLKILAMSLTDDYKFEKSDQVSERMLELFSEYLIYYFDVFKPDLIINKDGSFSSTFLKDYKLYGIKKGDPNIKNKLFYFPQKGVFEILSSTFGDETVKKIHIDPAKFFTDSYSPKERQVKLQGGTYIFPEPNEWPYDNCTIDTNMRFPMDITDNNILSAKATIVYMGDNTRDYNIFFKIIRNDRSEFGYNITYFSAEKIESDLNN